MKNFPAFVTENGAASLILQEIPYKGIAYIRLLDTQTPELLLEECVSFARVCGADKIYGAGEALDNGKLSYPLHTRVITMTGCVSPGEDTWIPVREETVSRWRELYQRAMYPIDNSATLESRDEEKLLSGGAGFVYDAGGTLLGIAWVKEEELLALVSCIPGAGERVLRSALKRQTSIHLEVASTNLRAMRLYKRLGFQEQNSKSWYRIWEKPKNP